jgi:16S rRNA (cytosine1402-N4)-methyltransferase
MTYHEPVMVSEVLTFLAVTSGSRIIDATLGGGGHARVLAEAGAQVLGIDQDRDALDRIEGEPIVGVTPVYGNFGNLAAMARERGWDGADGVLMDLGVSSHQLDEGARGFSFRDPTAVLDMRMDRSSGPTAGDVVANASGESLYGILSSFGEEEHARSIADAIVSTRRVNPIRTTGDLATVIATATGAKGDWLAGMTVRVFQALRIEVNGELDALKNGLAGARSVLAPGGRIVVISYHSLEDRIVKLALRDGGWDELTKKPVTPQEEERTKNPRSRSAKLRAAVKNRT